FAPRAIASVEVVGRVGTGIASLQDEFRAGRLHERAQDVDRFWREIDVALTLLRLRLEKGGPTNVDLALFQIDLLPHQQVGFLAAQSGPKAEEKGEVLLWVRFSQFALRANEEPFGVHVGVIALRSGIL